MKVIRCPLVPKGFCVNLFGTAWTRDTSWIDEKVINHERIHSAQQLELLWIPFYVLYLLEWLYRLVQHKHWKKAYFAISFEREAYAHGDNLSYLKHRRPYSWIKML